MLIAHQSFRLNCDMILHDTIDIQKHADANRCSSYIELVVPNYNFNYQKQTNFRSGSCFDLKHGSPIGQFLAHLAKGHVSFCHHLASVVRRKL